MAEVIAELITQEIEAVLDAPPVIEVVILGGQGPAGDAGGGGGGTPGGSTGQVQFNDAGSFGGDAGLTYNKTTDTLTVGNLALTSALPVAQGGSGATTAAQARTNFGLAIGTDVQAYHVNLAAFSGLTGAADKALYFTGAGALSTFTVTSYFRTLADDTDAATARATLGLGSAAVESTSAFEAAGAVSVGIASHVAAGDPHAQYALESALAAVAVSGSASDLTAGTLSISRLADGSVTLAKIANIATARLLGRNTAGSGVIEELDATTAQSLLGLVIGTNVQAYDADLATIAGLTPTTDNFIQSKAGAWASRTPTQVTADLIAMVGDSGSGGTKGLVPAPAAGDAAASKFLKADGTWATPSGGGTQTNATLATAAGTATCTNTTTETSITPSVSGSLTIAANTAVQYETYRFVFRGHHSIVTGGTTYTLKLYFGSTVVAQTSALFTAACTNRAWEVTVDVVVTTTGASGAVWSFGTNTRFTAASTVASAEMVGTTANATTTIDFTSDQAVTLKATYTAASASNIITCTHATMTRMKS